MRNLHIPKRQPVESAPGVRANGEITHQRVRLIDADGTNRGEVNVAVARAEAARVDLDLVEIAGGAVPPVCRVMDRGRYLYEIGQREKAQRRAQKSAAVKEVKFRVGTARHDLDVRLRQVRSFLAAGHKVRVVVMLKGRGIGRPGDGAAVLAGFLAELGELRVEQGITVAGRDVFALVAPV